MKFTIKREVVKIEEKEVDVELSKSLYGDGITFDVDGWHIFELLPNGTGRIVGDVGDNTGLKILNGKIVLER